MRSMPGPSSRLGERSDTGEVRHLPLHSPAFPLSPPLSLLLLGLSGPRTLSSRKHPICLALGTGRGRSAGVSSPRLRNKGRGQGGRKGGERPGVRAGESRLKVWYFRVKRCLPPSPLLSLFASPPPCSPRGTAHPWLMLAQTPPARKMRQ